MKAVDVRWFPDGNMLMVQCDCGAYSIRRLDRWDVRCARCGASDRIDKLRNDLVKYPDSSVPVLDK